MDLISLYHTKVRTEQKIAFWAAFISCLLVHIYKFTNMLPNHDSLFSFFSSLNAVSSGRWFLSVAGSVSSCFDLPWINGVLSSFYLGITAAFVTALFRMEKPALVILTSVLLTTSPCTTETFFYEYTADAFFFGLMLATVGSYFCIIGSKHSFKKLFAGCVCLCLSCGIYQAYISFAALLFLCNLIVQLLDNRLSVKDGLLQICKQILLYAISLFSYYVIWKVILALTNQTPSSYQGIDSVGQIRLSNLLYGAVSSVANLLRWFLGGNLLRNPLTLYSILHYVIAIALISILITALIKSRSVQHLDKVALIFVCLIVCIPIISMWNFVSATLYRPMMMHSVMVLLILAMILFDQWATPTANTVFTIVLTVAIFNYCLLANIAYAEMDLTSKRSQATAVELMQTIHAHEDIQNIAFIGSRQDSLYVGQKAPGNRGYPLTSWMEEDLLYDHIHAYLYLTQYMGLEIPSASDEEIQNLQNHPNVQVLPAWPNPKNAVVIDGTLVIKLAG